MDALIIHSITLLFVSHVKLKRQFPFELKQHIDLKKNIHIILDQREFCSIHMTLAVLLD